MGCKKFTYGTEGFVLTWCPVVRHGPLKRVRPDASALLFDYTLFRLELLCSEAVALDSVSPRGLEERHVVLGLWL